MLNLYIGAVYGGPETETTKYHLYWIEISNLKDGYCDETRLGKEGFVDFVFHFPGSILKPEFIGLRTGRFSRKQMMLQIQCSVPADLVDADEERIEAFIFQTVKVAIAMAETKFKKAKIPYDLEEQIRAWGMVEKQ